MTRRRLIAGNWKMNGTSADLGEVTAISMAAETHQGVDVALCLPATLIERAVDAAPGFAIGGQDVHANASGAHTGCISAAMLLDAGATLTIVGHSERRAGPARERRRRPRQGRGGARRRARRHPVRRRERRRARQRATPSPTSAPSSTPRCPQRRRTPARLSIAYEPIWAIGTGKVADVGDIAEMHAALRQRLVARLRRSGQRDADPLRRLGQGLERRRNLRRPRCRRRAGRRRQPHGRRLRADRRSGGLAGRNDQAR